MKITQVPRLLLLLFLPLAILNTCFSSEAAAQPGVQCKDCNLILISIDTLRADALGIYGDQNHSSPFIDRFAKKSFFFRKSYSSSAWTYPSHYSMLTGRYATDLGLFTFDRIKPFKKSTRTLAEVLYEQGYTTLAITGGGYIGEELGFSQGFQKYVDGGRRFENNFPLTFGKLKELSKENKFFLFLHGFNAHRPYNAPRYITNRFVKLPAPRKCRGHIFPGGWIKKKSWACARVPGGAVYARGRYQAEVYFVDTLMERLHHYLEHLDLLKNTVVVITSDHGEEFMEHGTIDHTRQLYDEVIRVPLIIRLPGQQQGREIASPVSGIDLYPSLLEILQVEDKDPQYEGRSFVPDLKGQSSRDVKSIFASTAIGPNPKAFPDGVITHVVANTVIGQGFKLIEYYNQDFSQRYELFDLSKDAGEQVDLSGASGNKVQFDQMKAELEAWKEKRKLNVEKDFPSAKGKHKFSKGTLKTLKSLGYVN